MIDSHVHLLDPERFPFPSRTSGYRPEPWETAVLDDLLQTMDTHAIAGAVLIQPSVYAFDNAAIEAALAAHPVRFRGIAMTRAEPRRIARLRAIPGMVGIRLNLKDYAGGEVSPAALSATLDLAGSHGLIVELLAPAGQLAGFAAALATTGTTVILDHLGVPRLPGPDAGFAAVLALGRNERIAMKLSAPFRCTSEPAPWPSLRPILAAIRDNFAPTSLLWGSDWPFINLQGNPRPAYADVLGWRDAVCGPALVAQMNDNAMRLFGFDIQAGAGHDTLPPGGAAELT